jgi:hypothetical protein
MHDIHHFTPEYWRTWLSSVDWKVFAAGKSWLESMVQFCRRLRVLYDTVIVLA